MTEVAGQEIKTLSHQGRPFRLSLPINDCRPHKELVHLASAASKTLATTVNLEDYIPQLQTADIFPSDADGHDQMRVVCSVADRAQWEQHLRTIREKRLAQLGVSSTDPLMMNAPTARAIEPVSKSSWTGLHTPAVSTDCPAQEATVFAKAGCIKPTNSYLPIGTTQESLANQVAALKARRDEISRTVSQIANDGELKHIRSLSQREIIHKRLNSIQPVITRKASRIVSSVPSIPEELECSADDQQGADILITLGKSRPAHSITNSVALNRDTLHQHLASKDMSELIKTGPDCESLAVSALYPRDEFTYETFEWADEPLDTNVQMFGPIDRNTIYSRDSYGPWSLATYPLQPQDPMSMQYSENGFALPLIYDSHLDIPQPPFYNSEAINHAERHVSRRSSLNLAASEFVPFSQAIVIPGPESRAIPIVRPPEDTQEVPPQNNREDAECDFEADEAYGSDTRDRSGEGVTPTGCDAYDGFDSGSEHSYQSSLENEPSDAVIIPEENRTSEDRVRKFRFPSAVSAPATPMRGRTGLFDSASPNQRNHRKALSISLAPLVLTSTPRKSPRIFQKSVALEDTELDSIIMDLSVHPISGPEPDLSTLSSASAYSHLSEHTVQHTLKNKRSSNKMFLSHEDAKGGLLLDAMLTAKLSGISDSIIGLQGNVTAIEKRLDEASLHTRQRSEFLLEAIKSEARTIIQNTGDVEELRTQIIAGERMAREASETEAKLNATVGRLTQELRDAREALEATDLLAENHVKIAASTEKDMSQMKSDLTSQFKSLLAAKERVALLEDVKIGLQKSVGESTARAARLEGQLAESITFSSALQSQYSDTELNLTRLRKELVETQFHRDEAIAERQTMESKYEALRQHFQDSATEVAREQAQWERAKLEAESRIDDLEKRFAAEEQRRYAVEADLLQSQATRNAKRESIRRSIDLKMPIARDASDPLLLQRIKLLEEERLEAAVRYDRELTVRDVRLDQMMSDWREMSVKLAQSEALNDQLRNEIVTQADIEDRLRLDLSRSDKLIGSLELLLESSESRQRLYSSSKHSLLEITDGTEPILKSNNCASECSSADVEALDISASSVLPGTNSKRSKDRSVLGVISDNISSGLDVLDTRLDMDPRLRLQKSNAELKRMRQSWEKSIKSGSPAPVPVQVLTTKPILKTRRSQDAGDDDEHHNVVHVAREDRVLMDMEAGVQYGYL